VKPQSCGKTERPHYERAAVSDAGCLVPGAAPKFALPFRQSYVPDDAGGIMVYRIRYRRLAEQREDEAVVEANSPTEALVKFQHARSDWPDRSRYRPQVTSVKADELDPAPW
jgi:hypothetical protein